MTTLASIIGALLAALGLSVIAFNGERRKRRDAEKKAETIESSFESAKETAKHMEKVARARDQRLTEVMVSHTEALGKIEKAGLDIDKARGDNERIAGLFNHAFTREGDE